MKRAKKQRRPKKARKARPGTAPKSPATSPSQILSPAAKEMLGRAMQAHVAGRLPEAEELYRQILQTDPDQPDALHLLGVIAHQGGRDDQAIDLIGKAIAIRPNFVEAYNNMGLALQKLNRLEEAVASFEKALVYNPGFALAHNNLGVVLRDLGNLREAVDHYKKALASNTDYPEAHNNLGVALADLGELGEAEKSYRKALSISPHFADAHYNLGNVLLELGELEDSVSCFQTAVSLKPDYADAYDSLGRVCDEQGRSDDAVQNFQKAIALNDAHSSAHHNLGNSLKKLGQLDAARVSFEKALVLNSEQEDWFFNLGISQLELGLPDDAASSFQKALALTPQYPDAKAALAINYWLHQSWADCQTLIPPLTDLSRDGDVDPSLKFAGPYRALLHALISIRHSQPQIYKADDDLPSLFVLGESHSLAPAHTVVRLNDQDYRVVSRLIIGCKAWHLGNPHPNQYKSQFARICDSLPPGSQALSMFGEIDCRPDQGILRNYQKTGNDLEMDIRDLVHAYVGYVTGVMGERDITPVFYGVPARVGNSHGTTNEEEITLSVIIRAFNEALAEETQKRGLRFLDVYSLTNDQDGQSSGKYHIDPVHLEPTVVGILLGRI